MSINVRKFGQLTMDSSSQQLNAGFEWAKSRALAFAIDGTLVSPYYEAALPGRDAFCIRDVCHQSVGANLLGLQDYTKNMLFKFAGGIAKSRDWCSYWEIDKQDRPAPVDYKNDMDFWYNLPANFDMLDCCYKQYAWTGDRDYVDHPVFRHFYERTVTDYIDHWDKDKDGFPEHYVSYGRRGIASYVEDGLHPLLAGDLVAAQYAAFTAYSRIQEINGNAGFADLYEKKAKAIRELYNREWWNEENGRFNGALTQDRRFHPDYYYAATYLPFYFDLVNQGDNKKRAVQDIVRHGGQNVEEKSSLAEIFYKCGLNREAYSALLEMIDPQLKRREYPEVSFSVIGALFTGTMGMSVEAFRQSVNTLPRLTEELDWIKVMNVPLMGGYVDLAHYRNDVSILTNKTEHNLRWEAQFVGLYRQMNVNGVEMPSQLTTDNNGSIISTVAINLQPGDRVSVKIEKTNHTTGRAMEDRGN